MPRFGKRKRKKLTYNRNHALYALFPLISTDVLTPFVDLLEDALSEEVPSIVVRYFAFADESALYLTKNELQDKCPPYIPCPWLSTSRTHFPPTNVRPRMVHLPVLICRRIRPKIRQQNPLVPVQSPPIPWP